MPSFCEREWNFSRHDDTHVSQEAHHTQKAMDRYWKFLEKNLFQIIMTWKNCLKSNGRYLKGYLQF